MDANDANNSIVVDNVRNASSLNMNSNHLCQSKSGNSIYDMRSTQWQLHERNNSVVGALWKPQEE